jgi:SAM-dependent MidA family methyltransferase
VLQPTSETLRVSPVPSAANSITAAITAAGGAIPFEQFMSLALYGEGGFYQTGGKAGRRGDFITSPEVGPLFAAVIARYLDDCWIELGRPHTFDVVEVGAGPGTLARGVFDAKPECLAAMKYIAVEISAAQRELHPNFVESVEVFPEREINGVVLANELLDNLPFRLFVFDGKWKEAFVAFGDGDKFVEVLKDVAEIPSVLPQTASLGARAPIQSAARDWLTMVSTRLGRGRILVFDYCSASTSDIAASPWREWLRTYKDHGRGEHYLANPGSQDITVQVMLDQLQNSFPTLTISRQSDWLNRWGIEQLVDEGNQYWEMHKDSPGLAAIKMRSRRTELGSICGDEGLGLFSVMEILKP